MYRSYEEYMRNVLNYKTDEGINIMENFNKNTYNNYFKQENRAIQNKASIEKIPKLNITNSNNL